MQVQANINGRALVVNYGTNPQGQVAGAWAELPDGSVADLEPAEETQMWALAKEHAAHLANEVAA